MKKLSSFFLLISILSFQNFVFAQFGFEWIDPTKEHLRITTKQDGIYRITYEDLVSNGFPAGSIEPNRYKMFYKGEEIAIHVVNSSPFNFLPGDYVEFFGKKNDGAIDSQMFADPIHQNNPFKSFYSDEAVFFFTYNDEGVEGRRMIFSPETAFESTANFAWLRSVVANENQISRGRNLVASGSSTAFFSSWGNAKGYTGLTTAPGTKRNYNVPYRNLLSSATASPTLKVKLTGMSIYSTEVEVLVGPSSSDAAQRVVGSVTLLGYENKFLEVPLLFSDFPSALTSNLVVSFRLTAAPGSLTRAALSTIELHYPASVNANSAATYESEFLTSATERTRIQINNTLSDANICEISPKNDVWSLCRSFCGTTLSAVLPSGSTKRKIWVQKTTFTPTSIALANVFTLNPSGYDYIILTHSRIRQPVSGSADAVQAYANYRASAAGGGYNPLIVDIDNVYNLYASGHVSPWAVRKMMDHFLSTTSVKFLFIVGKGLDVHREYERNKPASLSWAYQSLIPPYGLPGSDNLFTQGMHGANFEPAVPTGRLSVMSGTEVLNYLEKIKAHENGDLNALWRKDFLHLCGGRTETERTLFRSYLDSYKAIIEHLFLGGRVIRTAMRSTSEFVEYIDISSEVNKGLLFITFFGHSSSTTPDIEIGKAGDPIYGYNNKDKYPMIWVNGCGSADIFANSEAWTENWVSASEKGATIVMGHSQFGFASSMHQLSTEFFVETFQKDSSRLSQPIGDLFQNALRVYGTKYSTFDITRINTHQFLLQGDPAVPLFPAQLPDYHTQDAYLSLQPLAGSTEVTAYADSFDIRIIHANLGIVRADDSVSVLVQRTFPNGMIKDYPFKFVPATYYADTLLYRLYVTDDEKSISAGLNRFEVFLDYFNLLEEVSEDNNSGVIEVFLPKGGVTAMYPREFSIQNQQPISFIGQNSNPYTAPRDYIFQLDTADTFTSPYFRSQIVNAGAFPAWTTSLPHNTSIEDSVVYYWRIKFADPATDEDSTWSQSSFVYNNEVGDGWAQAHFGQFKRNSTSGGLERVDLSRSWRFVDENSTDILVNTHGGLSPIWEQYALNVNGTTIIDGDCAGNSFKGYVVFVIDGTTGAFKPGYAAWGSACGGAGKPGTFFGDAYNTALTGGTTFLNFFINNQVDEGDYIILMSRGTASWGTYKASAAAAPHYIAFFENFGIPTSVFTDVLLNNHPFIMFGQKGNPSAGQYVIGDISASEPITEQMISFSKNLVIKAEKGAMTTPRIGPTTAWHNFYRDFKLPDAAEDRWFVDFYGVTYAGTETLLLSDTPDNGLELDWIDPSLYPYLRLRVRLEDSVAFTPYQIRNWYITYEEVPEGVLIPDVGTSTLPIDKQIGDTASYALMFVNISEKPFVEPLTVRYQVRNIGSGAEQTFFQNIGTLPVGDTLRFTAKIPVSNGEGTNKVTAFVNPFLQAEQNYSNNLLDVFYKANSDKTHPLVDVAFDGVHILSGDLVSPNPQISVSIRDENAFLKFQDTTSMDAFLKSCDTCLFKRINYSDMFVNWHVDLAKNELLMEYKPEKLADGRYTLLVRGRDVSGNESGVKPYQIDFEVINKSAITHFYPYPNPFSTSVRFVFTLTGDQIPDQLKIQIMTVSGKVVREITQDEIGPIRVGNNVSQYAWDGKDEFGDQLANGVYLYRVIVRSNGREMERRETSADDMFTKGFGKMYLLR